MQSAALQVLSGLAIIRMQSAEIRGEECQYEQNLQ